ncbi:MAG: glycosyltransferase family 39 protein [Acidobacteria bacterium]|nr:glycosyltransferase family 39 protein [Acidobacteriota bacterium]
MSRPALSLVVLLVAGAALFAAGMSRLSLPAVDDAFYARKGVEMGRAGTFFTVTWANQPTFQNPPLQVWIVGRSHQLFGEGDFAARLPSLLMALATLGLTYGIGCRLLDPSAALTGVAMLLITPLFVDGARRCMMEVPLTFWACLAMFIVVAGIKRPRIHVLLAVPLAAAILTKSVMGLLPLLIVAVAGFAAHYRPLVRNPWLWLGAALGLAAGASWTLHQWMTLGREAVAAHYLGEIAARSMGDASLIDLIAGYPLILLRDFQPLVLPGLVGAFVMAGAGRRKARPEQLLLVIWVLLPIVLYSFSGARSSRYIFPILPAMALCGGAWLREVVPRFTEILTARLAPAVAVACAVVFMVSPGLLTRDLNRGFKENAVALQDLIPADEPLSYLGDQYWEFANPLLYYAERLLATPAATPQAALDDASRRRVRLVLWDRDRLAELEAVAPLARRVLEGPRWVLVQTPQR